MKNQWRNPRQLNGNTFFANGVKSSFSCYGNEKIQIGFLNHFQHITKSEKIFRIYSVKCSWRENSRILLTSRCRVMTMNSRQNRYHNNTSHTKLENITSLYTFKDLFKALSRDSQFLQHVFRNNPITPDN